MLKRQTINDLSPMQLFSDSDKAFALLEIITDPDKYTKKLTEINDLVDINRKLLDELSEGRSLQQMKEAADSRSKAANDLLDASQDTLRRANEQSTKIVAEAEERAEKIKQDASRYFEKYRALSKEVEEKEKIIEKTKKDTEKELEKAQKAKNRADCIKDEFENKLKRLHDRFNEI